MSTSTYDSPEDGVQKPQGYRSPRPRDAATLILLRRDGPQPRVLMGRRHASHTFMPDKWVFPGGAVDRDDHRAPAASELREPVRQSLMLTASAARSRALALAAVRETFEEAGLRLAQRADVARKPARWADFMEDGFAPDLSALDLIARAITPPYRPRRFDARFFTAEADRLASLTPSRISGELEEIAWVDLSEAQTLDLPSVTRFVLQELSLRLSNPTRRPVSVRYSRGAQKLDTL